MSDTDPLRGDPKSSFVIRIAQVAALLRPIGEPVEWKPPVTIQRQCAWAWHAGATAALGWTESNSGVYPGSMFPHNPYEIIEEEP